MPAAKISTVAGIASWLLLAGGAAAQVFVGTGTGAIPDGGPGCGVAAASSLEVSFTVSGLTYPITDVEVAMTVAHPWLGDLVAVLVDPAGAEHVLFGNTGWWSGGTSCGDSSTLDGTYIFKDLASFGSSWWVEAADTSFGAPLETRSYRSTEQGGPTQVNPAPTTLLHESFNGLSAALANGVWVLRVTDWGGSYVGSVTAASLGINQVCSYIGITGIFDTVDAIAACNGIDVGPNVEVRGPGGDLTLSSGSLVTFYNDVKVTSGGRLTVDINPGLNPLLVALEASRLLGEKRQMLPD